MMRKNGSNDFLTLYNLNRRAAACEHAEEQVKRIMSYRLPFSNAQKKETELEIPFLYTHNVDRQAVTIALPKIKYYKIQHGTKYTFWNCKPQKVRCSLSLWVTLLQKQVIKIKPASFVLSFVREDKCNGPFGGH